MKKYLVEVSQKHHIEKGESNLKKSKCYNGICDLKKISGGFLVGSWIEIIQVKNTDNVYMTWFEVIQLKSFIIKDDK